MSTSPVEARLDGVLGGRTAGAFARAFGIRTVGDLLEHYPRRYARRGELTAMDTLPLGESITIVAEVIEVRERTMRARRGSILEVKIGDGHGILTLTFFNQGWRAKELAPGVRGIFAGKVGEYRGLRQLAHPDYELFENIELEGSPEAKQWAQHPIPIYPASGTLASWQIQKAMDVVLDGLGEIDDPVPADVRAREKLLPYRVALEKIHRPETDGDWKHARHTLRYREAFLLQAALLQQRARLRAEPTQARAAIAGGYRDQLDARLPFELTGDQRAVSAEIAADLDSTAPMNRLVQGEVGSGKTLVALRAMLAVADTGGQSALLAPTEVLASQHLLSVVRSLGPDLTAALQPTLLTGQMSTAERKRALLKIVSGQARIVIGTHALFSESVTFFDLGLVVVDEQHRFGVEQRESLRAKGQRPPHTLVLTATPIPRTVAMTVFGDLDVSTIAELPAGRAPIESFVVPLADRPQWMPRVWERMAEEIERGRQAFVVCPAIEITDTGDPEAPEEPAEPADTDAEPEAAPRPRAAVLSVLAELRALPRLAGLVIEPLHGRMSGPEKEAVMARFQAGEIHVLVATTVIEVGVDVANASTMVVLDADRFGISQLHQLRGRVGRGGLPGLCLLVTGAEPDTTARERVEAVASTTDGFALARIDLELRREGDVLGSTQSGGRSQLKLLRVVDDAELILQARIDAADCVGDDAQLTAHPALREALERRLDDDARAALAKN